ncbi:MAG: GAF domain-containing protein [Anaerolineae bacterium]|nr:GAF domain-containing protein [Anaerolineae bacterium]
MYLILPVVALNWASLPFPGIMLDPNFVVSDTGNHSDWPAKTMTPPIAYPDRLVEMDGTKIITMLQYLGQLSTYQVGDDINFTIEQPQNSVITATQAPLREETIPLIAFSAVNMWNYFWLYYFCGLIFLLIGIGTFYLRPDTNSAQIFALLTALGAISLGAVFDLNTTQFFTRLWLVGVAFVGSINLLLAAHFPYKNKAFVNRRWLNWIIFIPSLLVLVWAQWWLYLPSDPWAYAITWRFLFMLDGLGIAVAFILLGYRSLSSPSPLVKQQARIILVGAILAFSPLLVFFISAGMGITIPTWFPQSLWLPPVIIYPLAISYTIVRYRIMDTNTVVRHGVTYTLILGLMIGVLVLLVTGLTAAFGNDVSLNNPLFLAVIVIFVALVFDPLRRWLQRGLDQYLFQQALTLEQLRSDYNRELTTAVNADQVAHILLSYVQTGIPGSEPQLYLPDTQMGGYCNYSENGGSVLVKNDSPLVGYMHQTPEVLDLAIQRAWPPELRQQPVDILVQNAAVIAPMNNGQELLGWITLPNKTSGQPYNQNELTYLGNLADQSLIGLERANVMRRLESRVAELDLLSDFSQALNYTIDPDILMELVYTNYQRLLKIDNLFIALEDQATHRRYMAYYVENGERLSDKEGKRQPVTQEAVSTVWETGQDVKETDENGRLWWYAPLNAGADTLGVLFTYFEDPSNIPARHHQLFNVFADRTAVALDRLQTRHKLAARAQQLELINQVTTQLAATLELERLLNLILDKAIEILNTEAGTFMLTIEDTGELEFRVVRGPAGADLLGKRLPIGTGLAGSAAQTGRPLIQNKVQEDARWYGDVDPKEEFVSESILTVPLIRKNAVLGVLQVINKRNGAPFNQEDESLLTAFAGQAVIALENARLLEQTDHELQQRVNELFMLQQLDRDLTTTLELGHILNLTLDWALRVNKGSAGSIVLVDEGQKPYLKARRDYNGDFLVDAADANTLTQGILGKVLASGKPQVTGNVFSEPDYVAASYNTLSQITLPIIHQQKFIGVLAIESDTLEAFNDEELETAVRMTNHAAVAISNALLYQQVREANLAKSEFVSMVSHELKTPMTSMRGYTDLLLSGMTGDLSDQQKGFLETIAANIRRMSQQIQDLTDISRIETGQLRVETSPTTFTNIVSETVQTIRGPYDEKRIELHLDLPTDLPMVLADNGRLVQVLTNLLSNACKYSAEETDVYVNIYASKMVLEENRPPEPVVICTVKDNGYGISEEDQAKLFTKFFRAEDPNIRKATGTGLGLSITKGIVELHRGKMWVESELGAGTTFSFAIPQAIEI